MSKLIQNGLLFFTWFACRLIFVHELLRLCFKAKVWSQSRDVFHYIKAVEEKKNGFRGEKVSRNKYMDQSSYKLAL